MHKLLLLLAASLCATLTFSQATDTLTIHYPSDEYNLSKEDRQRLDKFLLAGWDRVLVQSFTDATDEAEYNVVLSKKRSAAVSALLRQRAFSDQTMVVQYFGEAAPVADNESEEGRALNRHTKVIGYRFPRIKPRPPVTDPLKPVTATLDNGFIITWRPGSLPSWLADNFDNGSGVNFQVITNTTEMRQVNMVTNTTRGEVLSSVLVFCPQNFSPCQLDSPVLVRVPIPDEIRCTVDKIKFYNAVAERGRLIWQEQSRQVMPETINGRRYLAMWMDNFCDCINFDIKIDPECFDLDSSRLLMVQGSYRNLTEEIRGLNAFFLPRRLNDSTHSIIYLKEKQKDAVISFSLYNGRRFVKSFRNQPLEAFPYNEARRSYVLSTDTVRFRVSKVKDWELVFKVNADRYRAFPDKSVIEFIYLNRPSEKRTVDISFRGPKKRLLQFKAQPLESIPYDPATGYYLIDKEFTKTLQLKTTLTKK